jgi:hypothetical protein
VISKIPAARQTSPPLPGNIFKACWIWASETVAGSEIDMGPDEGGETAMSTASNITGRQIRGAILTAGRRINF